MSAADVEAAYEAGAGMMRSTKVAAGAQTFYHPIKFKARDPGH